MNNIEILTNIFKKFPGVGSRQARRFVYFLLSSDENELGKLASSITELKESMSQCLSCYRFYKNNRRELSVCDICEDTATGRDTIMVVEKDVDLENIRKAGLYKGLYFVLGGTISLFDKNPGINIRAKELFDIVAKSSQKELKEVIIALSVNPEGENTMLYIKKILEPVSKKTGLAITTLGRGLSTGTELEYSDFHTLENALKNRA